MIGVGIGPVTAPPERERSWLFDSTRGGQHHAPGNHIHLQGRPVTGLGEGASGGVRRARTGAGEIADYVFADGGGGLIIADNDDLAAGYADALAYQQWMDFKSTPILAIDDAMPAIMTAFS